MPKIVTIVIKDGVDAIYVNSVDEFVHKFVL